MCSFEMPKKSYNIICLNSLFYGRIKYMSQVLLLDKFSKTLPFFGSHITMSEISNSLRGNGMFLFLLMVFSIPGSSVVLATC